MKNLCLLTLGLCALVIPVFAGPTDAAKEAEKKAASTTSSNLLDAALPQSVFSLTNGPVKDPFFPNSTRTNVKVVATTSAPVTISVSEFKLNGISGIPGNRLALINNYNFAEGESANITTPMRKVIIKVIQIKEYSAVIRVAGQEESYEVFLAKNLR